MKRTEAHHPFVKTVQQFVKTKGLLQPGQTIVAAVSGGADSMVMLRVLKALQPLWNFDIVVAHLNYGLRGKASDGDEALVRTQSKEYGFAFSVKKVSVMKAARAAKRSVQETARDIRYAFFEEVAEQHGADAVLTAHHADDNTETMFFNFLRGSGIDGLAGIPEHRGMIIRPMLCVTRKQILTFAKDSKVKFRSDASNAHDDYTRNFLRNNVIPVLQHRINPSLHETLKNESDLFRAASDFVAAETETAMRRSVSNAVIDLKSFNTFHPFLQQHVIRRMVKERGIEPSFILIRSILALADQQKGSAADLRQGWIAERLASGIELKYSSAERPFNVVLKREGTIRAGEYSVSVRYMALPRNIKRTDPSIEYVDAATITFPLIIRSWKHGDTFVPLGMRGEKKLSDFFGELKLSSSEKMKIPVVECGGAIVWVAGKRLDERFKLTDSTTAVYQLTIHYGKENDHR